MLNLNMLFMAIQRLPKPTKEEEKISVEVNDYSAYFIFKHRCPSSEDSPPVTNSFSTITLVSVQYSYEGREEFQWELATEEVEESSATLDISPKLGLGNIGY